MLVRIRFSKLGTLKFIGHLDVMRYFQKLLSRSGLPIKYSQGFHPHQIMSFAAPLGVGLTGDGEYMDFELTEDRKEEDVLKTLQSCLTEGFLITKLTILEPRILNVKKESSMALVDAADYMIYQKLPGSGISKESFEAFVTALLEQDMIPVMKKTKTTEKEIDIKPLIYCYGYEYSSFLEKTKLEKDYISSAYCSIKEPLGPCLYLQLSAGSSMNLKPELILQELVTRLEPTMSVDDFGIHHLEMYHVDEKGCRIPLWAIK